MDVDIAEDLSEAIQVRKEDTSGYRGRSSAGSLPYAESRLDNTGSENGLSKNSVTASGARVPPAPAARGGIVAEASRDITSLTPSSDFSVYWVGRQLCGGDVGCGRGITG